MSRPVVFGMTMGWLTRDVARLVMTMRPEFLGPLRVQAFFFQGAPPDWAQVSLRETTMEPFVVTIDYRALAVKSVEEAYPYTMAAACAVVAQLMRPEEFVRPWWW